MASVQTYTAARITKRYSLPNVIPPRPALRSSLIGVGDREPERLGAQRSAGDVLERQDDREEEDRADDARQPDRRQDAARRLSARVERLLAERAGRVEAVHDEQAHEHRRSRKTGR